jgi:hypothetical protein
MMDPSKVNELCIFFVYSVCFSIRDSRFLPSLLFMFMEIFIQESLISECLLCILFSFCLYFYLFGILMSIISSSKLWFIFPQGFIVKSGDMMLVLVSIFGVFVPETLVAQLSLLDSFKQRVLSCFIIVGVL